MGSGRSGVSGLGLWIVVAICFVSVGFVLGDAGVDVESDGGNVKVAPLFKEIERLKAQVGVLEESLKERDGRLKETVKRLEHSEASLKVKAAHIGVVESELETLRKDSGDKDALTELEHNLEVAILKVQNLESKLVDTRKELEGAKKDVESLKKRAEAAEDSLIDLDFKYEEGQRSLQQLKIRAQTAEQTLKVAEAAMLEAESKAHYRTKELLKVTNQWLPHWAATRVGELQAKASAKWVHHVKPHVDVVLTRTTETAAATQAWLKPHVKTVSSKVGRAARKYWRIVAKFLAPYIQTLRSSMVRGYEVIRKDYIGKAQEFVKPHIDTVVEVSRPYVVLIQEHTRPYVDQVSTMAKPYWDQGRQLVNPYLEVASPYYRDAVSAAVRHHKNLQATVKANLAKHDLGGSLISQELIWFLASALLALPVLTLFLVFSSAFGSKKPQPKRKNPTHGGNGNHKEGHRKRSKRT